MFAASHTRREKGIATLSRETVTYELNETKPLSVQRLAEKNKKTLTVNMKLKLYQHLTFEENWYYCTAVWFDFNKYDNVLINYDTTQRTLNFTDLLEVIKRNNINYYKTHDKIIAAI